MSSAYAKHSNLTEKLKLSLAALCFIALILFYAALKERHYYTQGKKQALGSVQTIVAIKRIDRVKFSNEINTLVSSDIGITTSHDHEQDPLVAPNPATFHFETCGLIKNAAPSFRNCTIFSAYPWATASYRESLNNGYEQRALAQLSLNADPYVEYIYEDGKEYVFYSEAMKMDASCVDCHNNHPLSPKKDWRVGDLRGREGAVVALEIQRDYIAEVFFLLLLGVIAALIAYLYLFQKRVTKNYAALKADEYGIDGLDNLGAFLSEFDKTVLHQGDKPTLLLCVNITNYDELINSGEDTLFDSLHCITTHIKMTAKEIACIGRYNKSTVVTLCNDIGVVQAKALVDSFDELLTSKPSQLLAELSVNGLYFTPNDIDDHQRIFRMLDEPALNTQALSFTRL